MFVTWLGHASVLIELDGVRLLTDPVLGNRIGPLVRIAPPVQDGALPPVDAVLLSHLRADHADLPSLRRIARSIPVLAPLGAGNWLRRRGLGEVQELGPGDEKAVAGVRVQATEASHDGRRWPVGPAPKPMGFVVHGSRSAYFAGDTDLFAAMDDLRGSIDVALLPIWGWGPSVGAGHLDPQRAAQAAAMILPDIAIPIHWGTFALARPARRPRDPGRPARQFAALMGHLAPSVAVRVLAFGVRTQI